MRLLFIFLIILIGRVAFASELVDPRFQPALYASAVQAIYEDAGRDLLSVPPEFPLYDENKNKIDYSIVIKFLVNSSSIKYEIYFFKPKAVKPFVIQQLGETESGEFYLGLANEISENYQPDKNTLIKMFAYAQPISRLGLLNCDKVIGKIFSKK